MIKPKRVNICWGIKSGAILLPFSIRTTKKQAIYDYVWWRILHQEGEIQQPESAVKDAWTNYYKHKGISVVKVQILEL